MRELLSEIERALRARGWSARQASMEAVGSPELINNMRRGRVPSVERVKALCDVLDLEFYVGRRRQALDVDEERLALALEAAERGLATSGRTMDSAAKAKLVAEVYQLIGNEKVQANAARMRRLIAMVAGNEAGDASPRRTGEGKKNE